jgi:hypothetical protein
MEVLRTDAKPNQCHRCGSSADLTRHEFGIAKVLSVKRDWSGTVGYAAASAISIALAPALGGGALVWQSPGKRTSYRVLRAELVLCGNCLDRTITFLGLGDIKLRASEYRCHPWAEKARKIGFDKYLSTDELAKLTPIRSSR